MRDDRITRLQQRPTAVPAENVEVCYSSDGVELCTRDTGRKLITVGLAQITDFIQQLAEAQGAALAAHIEDARSRR